MVSSQRQSGNQQKARKASPRQRGATRQQGSRSAERSAPRTLGQSLSPLEQARYGEQVRTSDVARQLSQRDQATLKQILTQKYDYVHNELFEQEDAERRIFDEAPEIPEPDTSWYHPVMEYLDEPAMGKNEGTVLLSAAEERALFLKFNYCRYMVAKLREEVRDEEQVPLDHARRILQWHRWAEQYREQIANTNLALVLAMAKKSRMSEVDFADLISEGNMALLRAVDKFDASRGFKFSTYACRAILKAFSRIGVKTSKYRLLFPTDFDPKLERSDYMEKKRESHEEDCVDEIRQIVRNNRADLSDIEQEVIQQRFAIRQAQNEDSEGGEGQDDEAAEGQGQDEPQPLTLEQVGKRIGVTKERVRQIQNKALQKIRMTLEGSFLE